MNKEEFISHCMDKLKPWADLQLILNDPSSIDEEQKKDISKLISPSFYSTKESLIVLLQLIQGFLINGNEDLPFYFSIHEFLIPKIKEFLTSDEIYSIYHKTFNHVLLWYYEHGLLDIETISRVSKNEFDIFMYFSIELKEHDSKIYEIFQSQIECPFENSDVEEFKRKRKERINENLVAKLIREDNINEFQNLISSTNLKIDSRIPFSLFEACISVNYSSDMPTLIEYASFFGSINIFKYLLMQNATINSNIWGYAVHGKNYDIIHMIEDKHIEPFYCVQSSIRYYRYDLFEYFTETKNIEICRDCINRAILNFNLPILCDSKILGSLYDEPNKTSSDSGDWNPLICSALKSYPIITELLLLIPTINTNVIYRIEYASPLIVSVRNSCLENVKLLCKHKMTDLNLHVSNRNAFCMAAGVGDLRCMDYFLSMDDQSELKKLDIDFNSNRSPFIWAVSNFHLETVKFLYFDERINRRISDSKVNVHYDAAMMSVNVTFWDCFEFLIQSESDQNFEEFKKLLLNNLKRMSNYQDAEILLNKEIERRGKKI